MSVRRHRVVVMDKVKTKSQTIIITKYDQPIVKIVPVVDQADDIFGFMKGKAKSQAISFLLYSAERMETLEIDRAPGF
jgi:antitoxin (DNA-binding transcriptional repressor) of toxin-antitoxin stability system